MSAAIKTMPVCDQLFSTLNKFNFYTLSKSHSAHDFDDCVTLLVTTLLLQIPQMPFNFCGVALSFLLG